VVPAHFQPCSLAASGNLKLSAQYAPCSLEPCSLQPAACLRLPACSNAAMPHAACNLRSPCPLRPRARCSRPPECGLTSEMFGDDGGVGRKPKRMHVHQAVRHHVPFTIPKMELALVRNTTRKRRIKKCPEFTRATSKSSTWSRGRLVYWGPLV
jgi:hypothetical protein